jgi:hypothetical protein
MHTLKHVKQFQGLPTRWNLLRTFGQDRMQNVLQSFTTHAIKTALCYSTNYRMQVIHKTSAQSLKFGIFRVWSLSD